MHRPILSSLILAAALVAGGTLGAAPAQARGAVVVYATSAPPPLRVERIPPPRRGYVWIGGSWEWSHGRYRWAPGYWTHVRPGYHYAPARWVHGRNGWYRERGHWHH